MSETNTLDYRRSTSTAQVLWIQTGAMLLDSYRELNARKLFWITMIVSGVVAGSFALVGIDDRGISIFIWRFEFLQGWNTHVLSAGKFYKYLFSWFGISLWLAWPATILGLVSTASMFPDFLSSGAVDLYLARPLSRLRLFLTKYLMGLLFMGLQVSVFTFACFLVIGIRGGVWEPSLFLAVPIVTLLFSFLFSISALVGTLTRSTIAAVMITLIMWAVFACFNSAESAILPFQKVSERNVARLTKTVAFWDKALATTRTRDFEFQHNAAIEALDKERDGLRTLSLLHNIFYVIKLPLPKTAETADLLRRALVKNAELPFDTTTMPSEDEPVTFTEPTTNPEDRRGPRQRGARHDRDRQAEAIQAELEDTRSISYTLGTSIGFEAVLLVIAAWVFCRRDY